MDDERKCAKKKQTEEKKSEENLTHQVQVKEEFDQLVEDEVFVEKPACDIKNDPLKLEVDVKVENNYGEVSNIQCKVEACDHSLDSNNDEYFNEIDAYSEMEVVKEEFDEENTNLSSDQEVNIDEMETNDTGNEETDHSDLDYIPKISKNKSKSNNTQPSTSNGKTASGVIVLPNIKRAIDVNRCMYTDCCNSNLRTIPQRIRISVFKKYKFFISAETKICTEHYKANSYNDIPALNGTNEFTGVETDNVLNLLNGKDIISMIDSMPDNLMRYWTGVPKATFDEILTVTELDDYENGSFGLLALLASFWPTHSESRLCEYFKTTKEDVKSSVPIAKDAILKHPECIKTIMNAAYSKQWKKKFKQYLSRYEK